MNGRFWAAEDLQVIRWLYPYVKTEKLAAVLGRKGSAVYAIANKLGLRKTAEYLASPDSGILLPGQTTAGGVATQFKPGMGPWNKGAKMPTGWSPGRMRETQFKKGSRTGAAARNWVPIGTVKTDTEGFLRIKVREGIPDQASGFGNSRVWPMLNRHVWEQHNGPIPPSHVVVFRNGDRSNCSPENLLLLSRAQLMARNTIHNLPEDLKEVIRLNGKIKQVLRRRYAEKQDDRPAQSSL
jgi:hypothetical protein